MSEHPTPPTPEREPSGEERAAYGQTSGAPGSGWGAPHAGPSAGHAPPPQATDTPAAFNPTPFAPPVPVQPRPRRQRRIWPAVFAAGLLGASFASVGTAFLVGESITSPTPAPAVSSQPASAPAVAGTPDWASIAEEVRPAVVAIQVTGANGSSAGSGVVIDDDGRILTNNHVIAGAEKLQIMMVDGRLYRAEVVGADPTTDLAVVQIKDAPDNLTPGTLGSSASLEVGEPVMAVGNPLGLDSTVTTGIISALERPVMASDESDRSEATITNAIQVDAAINPGNSGGPLFNSAGQVIGINSSIATTSRSGGSVGLGFAIPIDLASQIADQLIQSGKVEHAFLGVAMTDAAASADGATRMGAKVEQVDPGTPAAEAGIKTGDVIVGIDDHIVGSAESLTGFVRQYRAGDEVKITLIRGDSETTLTATLATKPQASS